MPPKKGKKKGGKPTNVESTGSAVDDDWEAALEEFGADSKSEDVPKESSQAPETAKTSEVVANEKDNGEEEDQEKSVDAAADYLATLGVKVEGEGGEKKDKKKKKKDKKKKAATEKKDDSKPVSAAGKLLLERQAALKAEQERLKAAQEAEEKRIAELEAKREEEERLKREAADRKKEARRLKKEQQRKEGTYMTKAEKAKAAKARAALEQMQAAGLVVGPGEGEEEKQAAKKKRPVYADRKKKGGKKKAQEEEANPPSAAPAEKAEQEEGEAEVAESEEASVKEETKKEEEPAILVESWDQAGDWDDDDWENASLTVKLKNAKAEEEVEDLLELEKKQEEERLRQRWLELEKKKAEEEAARASRESEGGDEGNGNDGLAGAAAAGRKVLSKEAQEKKQAAAEKRKQREAEAMAARSADKLRSPICCIMGHVDTGKTKLLDKIRSTNVQDAEAGGITQQIGATFFPVSAIQQQTARLNLDSFFSLQYKLPGLLVIDTPGHESFTNLRSRGSSLCDIAILVVDIMHGLEPQTLESLNLLRRRRTPFVVALNKIDRCYGWKTLPNIPAREALEQQPDFVQREFRDRATQIMTAFSEQGLNARLYWENDDLRRQISLIPTSAISGEGVADLQLMLVKLTQEMMSQSLMFVDSVQCTILEVKVLEGLGTTIDAVLVNGVLREGDQVVVCTLDGPVVTTIRSLLTPQPMREMRVKGDYIHHPSIEAAMGVKICAQGVERAVAGTPVMVVGPEDDVEDIKEEVMADLQNVIKSVTDSKRGVYVQSSTLGALEALLEFLRSCDPPIPVAGVNIGPVHKKDVMRASVQLEHHKKEYATILAFDVKVNAEAREMADNLGVKVFTADIIYHLFDQFTAYLADINQQRKLENQNVAVFPCSLRILPQHVFNKKDPIILGVDVVEGILKVGTPLCIPQQGMLDIGRVISIENNHKEVETARKGSSVAIKIAASDENPNVAYGRHFDHLYMVYSKLSRASIDALKENFKDDLGPEDWRLVVKLKPIFGIL